ncbi:unnamed protein product [Rotaria magnacalcarata]|nr:unnamed protein product [Rotaria magnacalcarata]
MTRDHYWRTAPVSWRHNFDSNSLTFQNVAVAKSFMHGLANSWNLLWTENGRQFIQNLWMNLDFPGSSSSDYKEAEYKIHGQNGQATYILVITGQDMYGNTTIAYAYEHVDEQLFPGYGYTSYAEGTAIDWLKWHACNRLQATLPWYIAPRINFIV